MKKRKPPVRHTSDIHKLEQMWVLHGGVIESVRRTGETRYRHGLLERPLTVNGRRNHAPAKFMTLVNRITKLQAANDPRFDPHPNT